MPNSGRTKPNTDHRLSDHLAFAMLARVFPPSAVDAAIAEAGRLQRRNRLLPARVVVYYVLGLALFSRSSYEEVIRLLVAGRAWSSGWSQSLDVPTKAALFKARARLGYEPLQSLFEQLAQPLAPLEPTEDPQGRLAVLGLDKLMLEVPDTSANQAEFGGEGVPTVALVGLTELSTGAIIGATIGAPAAASVGQEAGSIDQLSSRTLERIGAGSLVLIDQSLYTPTLWSILEATDAELLAELPADAAAPEARLVAVTGNGETRRLATTLVGHRGAGDADLIRLFDGRRRLLSAFDEFRAQPDAPRIVLRSRVPDGVRQELYGFLCVHYAMRQLLSSGFEGYLEADSPESRSATSGVSLL